MQTRTVIFILVILALAMGACAAASPTQPATAQDTEPLIPFITRFTFSEVEITLCTTRTIPADLKGLVLTGNYTHNTTEPVPVDLAYIGKDGICHKWAGAWAPLAGGPQFLAFGFLYNDHEHIEVIKESPELIIYPFYLPQVYR